MKAHLVTAVLWIIWCVIHSAMISLTVTNYLRRKLGDRFRYHRIVFNLVSAILLIPIIIYGYGRPGHGLFRWDGSMIFLQVPLLTAGLLLLLAGARHYDMFQFLGLRQLKTSSSHRALTNSCRLDTSGILAKTRHPWYLAAVLLIWSRGFEISTVLTNVVLTVYLSVGTFLEERKLLIEFGQEYRDYQRRVSILFPFKWLVRSFKRPARL
jgi:protein-S-isoprenylcysteine O-methyltransferase Ste14